MFASLAHQGAVVGSIVSSSLGLWRGMLVQHEATQPPLPLVLYDYEACPFCRHVREALTALNLDVTVKPCPRKGQRFRPEALQIGGRLQFPLLIDTNTDTTLYESQQIVGYLFRTYGTGEVPAWYRPQPLVSVQNALAFAVRVRRGLFARPSRSPAQPLHLWSFEASPYARLVRERLTELELPYVLHNLGKESLRELGPARRRLTPNPYVPKPGGKRHAFWQAHGTVQVPYLEDPNGTVAMFDSARIIAYLESAYAVT